ncbi:hypothetical protein DQ353_12495 [Arthrobacter sp. AQ5-05]|nr:hypothetical protein DQ353_12495 [Arthrobacter sp. AQ5-05]
MMVLHGVSIKASTLALGPLSCDLLREAPTPPKDALASSALDQFPPILVVQVRVHASAHRVSLQTLQRSFAGTGRGLSSLIRRRRLEAVRRDLVDPRLANPTIAEIAAAWCLPDAQWLAKAFKAEFDLSPSEFRRSGAAVGLTPVPRSALPHRG